MRPAETARLNTLWGDLIAEELLRSGVELFVISPGSRSTPLTAAAARHPRAAKSLWLDERGAAYHALGHARATGRPAALICTSGTAVANYLPAVMEASLDCVPLLLFTADRPPELRETGANQAARQPGLFAEYARWQFDLPAPDPAITARMVLTAVDQAVHRSVGPPAGPVHVNCMFREPLEPVARRAWPADIPAAWREGAAPLTRYARPEILPSGATLDEIARTVRGARRGLLIAGHLATEAERDSVRRLAGGLGWPVAADVRSGLRLGGAPETLVPYLDQLLIEPRVRESFAPDVVLHLGGQPVSKRLSQALGRRPPGQYIIVKDHPFRHDPAHQVTHRVQASVAPFCDALAERNLRGRGDAWGERLLALSERAGEVIEGFIAEQPFGEIAAARILSREIPADHGLFLASSMPIRDMDMFGDPAGPAPAVAANRGASGIDGTVSAACGFARGLGRPVTLLTGDLSLLHDLNALGQLRSQPQPLVIVLVNNSGGGIFHFLPIAGHADLLDPWFTAPHAADFGGVRGLFGIPCHRPKTAAAFATIYRRACRSGTPALIEVRTDRAENLAAHRALGAAVAAKVRSAPGRG